MANPSLTARRKQHRVPSISPSMSPFPSGVHAQSTAAHMGLMTQTCVCLCCIVLQERHRKKPLRICYNRSHNYLSVSISSWALIYRFKNPWSEKVSVAVWTRLMGDMWLLEMMQEFQWVIWIDFIFWFHNLKKKKDIGCLCCSCGKTQTISHLGWKSVQKAFSCVSGLSEIWYHFNVGRASLLPVASGRVRAIHLHSLSHQTEVSHLPSSARCPCLDRPCLILNFYETSLLQKPAE